MDITSRLLGRCWRGTKNPDAVEVDPAALAMRLLLYDHLVIESATLREIPHLVQLFGYGPTMELLGSGAVTFLCDAATIVNGGQHPVTRRSRGVLPLGSYSFATVRSPTRREYVDSCLTNLRSIPGVRKRENQKLRLAAVEALREPPEDTAFPSLEALKQDISANRDLLATALRMALKREAGIDAIDAPVTATIHWINEHDFRLESNIQPLWALDGATTHKVGQRAVLGISGANLRVEKMRAHNALSEFLDQDAPILSSKLSFLLEQISPKAVEGEATRVLSLAGVPVVATEASERPFDLARLLEIRQSPECQAFRSWLRQTPHMSDDDIRERVNSLRAHLGRLARTGQGKALRWLISTAVGLIPGAGVVAGPALGALDAFVLENIFPHSAPIAFLTSMYPSIFEA